MSHHHHSDKPELDAILRREDEILDELEEIEHELHHPNITHFTIQETTMQPIAPGFSPVFTATPQPAGNVLNPTQPVPSWTSSDPTNAPVSVDSTGLVATVAVPATAVVGTSFTLSISYTNGWKAIGTLVYSWPQALSKAHDADRIVRRRLTALGLHFDEIYTEYFGVNACHGQAAPPNPDPPEVQLRIGVRGQDRRAVDRFTRELIPLVLNGPPGATGFGEGRPPVREIVAYWSALIPRGEIQTQVEVVK